MSAIPQPVMPTMIWQQLFQLQPAERQRHRIHLVGIGGTGLAPIAQVLLELGFRVSGSDREPSVRTETLVAAGADVFIGHDANHLFSDDAVQPPPTSHPDLVLISSAIPTDNPEVLAAQAVGIPVVKRNELLGPLTADRTIIAVAGTHGKTTTTGMIAHLLTQAGLEPGYIIGSSVPGLGISAAGKSSLFVIEADEYDYAFLGLHPHTIVLTSLEWDHPDCFPTRKDYQVAYGQFLDQLRPGGNVIYCQDDAPLPTIFRLPEESSEWSSYGIRNGVAWKVSSIDMGPTATTYVLSTPTGEIYPVQLAIPGLHNILNSVGALIAANQAGIPLADAVTLLHDYRGAERRFEIKGEVGDVVVIDDYAHHPTEIRTTLSATRAAYPDRDIWAVYQPHTYSRTRTFLGEFEGVFASADHLIVTGIYAAREPIDPMINSTQVIAASRHEMAQAIDSLPQVLDYLVGHVRPHSVIIILSAGTATWLGPELLKTLALAPVS